ncbi:PREDICTED: uncharacterized oxidoreductase At4g09670-like [Ipomoea nil]|uniref:uncharacterized oxidoreductase At4g09670-like n=1 Tax=Ipomoea nil TaxID=35883 RepID=UPI000901D473|nr:PREDICTED: uncharacterized oxidoreductase At4g09670-like [Ipomoea nil]
MAEQKQIRFGILGCATVARKLARAISLAPNATISAVGSRTAEKAAAFAAETECPATAKIYGSYDAVLDDPDVDAVYIPLPTSLHVRWAVLAAQKKKHILVEKPAALNVAELDQILAACESSGVQFMDGTVWTHHPRTAKMKEFLSDPLRFGQLKSVHSIVSFLVSADSLKNDIRVKPDLDGLGALGDAGWYCIHAILWANDYELPESVTAVREPEVNEAGVILSCGASMKWKDGRVATFYCSFLAIFSTDICAYGTKGKLRVHDFVIPFAPQSAPFYTFESYRLIEHGVAAELPQDVLMVMEFCNLAGSGRAPEKKWAVISRKTQLVVDAVNASIHNGFETIEVVY